LLINWLLMACWCRHFEARQRPEDPECWCHMNTAVWPEVCKPCSKAWKHVWAKNYSRTKRTYLEWHIIIIVWPGRNLTRGRLFKIAEILTLKRNYNPRQYIESANVTSDHFSFLLPTFESGFRCSHNGGLPVIWIISHIYDIRYIL